jgi:glycogen debranching enzyme
MGFSRYGMQDHATRILNSLYEVSRHVELNRLPELFCGFHKRPEANGPTLYPVACSPQAWAAGSAFLLLRASLGLTVQAHSPQIHFEKPSLPMGIDELRIRNLRMNNSSADFLVRRVSGKVRVEITRQDPGIEIVTPS